MQENAFVCRKYMLKYLGAKWHDACKLISNVVAKHIHVFITCVYVCMEREHMCKSKMLISR